MRPENSSESMSFLTPLPATLFYWRTTKSSPMGAATTGSKTSLRWNSSLMKDSGSWSGLDEPNEVRIREAHFLLKLVAIDTSWYNSTRRPGSAAGHALGKCVPVAVQGDLVQAMGRWGGEFGVTDRLADDREPQECRYLMRFWWQLGMPYQEVSMDQISLNVSEHGTRGARRADQRRKDVSRRGRRMGGHRAECLPGCSGPWLPSRVGRGQLAQQVELPLGRRGGRPASLRNASWMSAHYSHRIQRRSKLMFSWH
jgi:hypothetical protein